MADTAFLTLPVPSPYIQCSVSWSDTWLVLNLIWLGQPLLLDHYLEALNTISAPELSVTEASPHFISPFSLFPPTSTPFGSTDLMLTHISTVPDPNRLLNLLTRPISRSTHVKLICWEKKNIHVDISSFWCKSRALGFCQPWLVFYMGFFLYDFE